MITRRMHIYTYFGVGHYAKMNLYLLDIYKRKNMMKSLIYEIHTTGCLLIITYRIVSNSL